MNCQQIQKLIHAYHDGELDAANTMQVDEHLADCPGCFGTVRQLSALSGALQNSELRFSAPGFSIDHYRRPNQIHDEFVLTAQGPLKTTPN